MVEHMTLDLGCGRNKLANALGVDNDPACAPDLLHDLDQHPWPLPDDAFAAIRARHVIEHLNDLPGFMAELWRVARPGCRIEIVTPHFSNPMSYADPTHKRTLSARFIEFYCETPARGKLLRGVRAAAHLALESEFDLPAATGTVRFRLIRRRLTFPRIWRLTGLAWLANRCLSFYEFYLSGVFRGRDIELELEALKGQ